MATIARLLVVLGLLLLTGAGVAAADPPLRLAADVVDRAGVLGTDAGRVQAAVARLRSESDVRLWVVYVRSFDGADGQSWADLSAERSQLGPRDALLAVAVDDREQGVSIDERFPFSDGAVRDIVGDDVEPRLAAGDWAGAAVAMADGLRGGGSASGGGATPWVVGGTLALIGGAYAVSRRRKRAGTAGSGDQPAQPADEFAGVSTEDLGYRASSALLELDDAVRTSEQELDLARAQFGEEAVGEFRAALDASRAEMVRAFGVRQQLDDGVGEDDPTQRAMLADILGTCATADARLDEQAAAFDRLRDLERTAPEVVAALTPALDAAHARVPGAEQRFAELAAAYAASALAPVADNVGQARARLVAAREEVAQAQVALVAGKRGEAVVSARAAEDALAQAATLLDGIERLADELARAGARIADARAEVDADLAEARTLSNADSGSSTGSGAGELTAVVARAQAALVAADRDLAATPPDPLAALRRLTDAGAALDAGIAAAREGRVRAERAAAALDRALLAARSAVAAASDFVSTRRGAVGSPARTRLAEAGRHLDIATGTAGTDPVAALHEAQQADALAQEALRLARDDVSRWSAPGTAGGTAIDFGSLVLGGILFGDDRGRGGGFGGGGFGGSGGSNRGGGGFSPGSFGGSGTRGRRGTGGRF
ncbi:MAG: TPM domain-containing protein [Pseudonocardia sp.]